VRPRQLLQAIGHAPDPCQVVGGEGIVRGHRDDYGFLTAENVPDAIVVDAFRVVGTQQSSYRWIHAQPDAVTFNIHQPGQRDESDEQEAGEHQAGSRDDAG